MRLTENGVPVGGVGGSGVFVGSQAIVNAPAGTATVGSDRVYYQSAALTIRSCMLDGSDDIEEYPHGANLILAGGGIWAAWLAGIGVRTSWGLSLPDASLLAVSEVGDVLVCPSYSTGTGLAMYDINGLIWTEANAQCAFLYPYPQAFAVDSDCVLWRDVGGKLHTIGLPAPAQAAPVVFDPFLMLHPDAGGYWVGYHTGDDRMLLHPLTDASKGYVLATGLTFGTTATGAYAGFSRNSAESQMVSLAVDWSEPLVPLMVQPIPTPTPVPPTPTPTPTPTVQPTPTPLPSPPVPTMTDRLVSQDGRFTLIQQNDGNLVTYGPDGPLWASGALYVPPPPGPGAPRPTADDVTNVRCNFCNISDSQNRPIFSVFYPGLSAADRADWLAKERAAGGTHYTIAAEWSYPDYWAPSGNMLNNPQALRAVVLEVLNAPSATGRGFVPILFLDGGGPNPRTRIDAYWANIINTLRDLLPYMIIVPGWELIAASAWTSADMSYGLKALGALNVPNLWVHLSQGRASFASNPVEPDDPWHGAEKDCWYTHGGEFATGFLYQSYTVRNGDNVNCDPANDECWLNRWADVVPRIGNGMNGWRQMPFALFEGPAYYFIRGECSSQLAREWAKAGKSLAASYGVTVGYGNGLP